VENNTLDISTNDEEILGSDKKEKTEVSQKCAIQKLYRFLSSSSNSSSEEEEERQKLLRKRVVNIQ